MAPFDCHPRILSAFAMLTRPLSLAIIGHMKKNTTFLAIFLVALLSFFPVVSHAEPLVPSSAAKASACWAEAARYHKVDVWLLYSVAWVESRFNPSAIGKNRNGSTDMGMMQINSIWLPELRKYGITSRHLLDGCSSVYIGAWILSRNIHRYGYTWRAIGAYNSKDPATGLRYAERVYAAHRALTGLPTRYFSEAALR